MVIMASTGTPEIVAADPGPSAGTVAPNRTCPTCERTFVDERSLSKHLARKNPCLPVGELKHHCTYCNIKFDKRPLITQHYKTKKHASAVERANGEARGDEVPEDLSGCEICKIESFSSMIAKTTHFDSKNHLAAVGIQERRDARRARLAWEAEARERAISEQVEGCDLCGNEGFKNEAARAAHLLTKRHLDAAERAERREHRRLGHRVQGRTNKARAAREERPAILRMEDYAVGGSEGSDRPQLHRVGRAFPRRQVPVSTPSPSEPISETPQGSPQSPTALTLEAAPPTTSSSDVPRQTTPVTDPQLGDPVPEAPTDGFTGQVASDAAPTLVIESAPGPIDTSMIVAETAARSMDRAGEVDGYSDAPQDDFVTYLLSRFSEPQKRMFAESYGLYMREDMRNKHCIDLDQATGWMGFTRKDTAVAHVKKNLQPEDYRTVQDNPPTLTGTHRSFHTAVKYYLTPRAFKKVLMRARTAQGGRGDRLLPGDRGRPAGVQHPETHPHGRVSVRQQRQGAPEWSAPEIGDRTASTHTCRGCTSACRRGPGRCLSR